MTGGVPANYGDVTGGLINITTRGPSREFFGGLEYLTSGYKVGSDITDIVGLDKYAFNQLEASLSGTPVVLSAIASATRPSPSSVSSSPVNTPMWWTMTRSTLATYGQDRKYGRTSSTTRLALSRTTTGDFALAYGSEFLRSSDLESIKTRQNAGRVDYLASGKIDITTTPTINLTVGGSLDYSDRQSFNRANSLEFGEQHPYQSHYLEGFREVHAALHQPFGRG